MENIKLLLKILFKILYRIFFSSYYNVLKIFTKIDYNKVLIVNSRNEELNFKYIIEELNEQKDIKLKIVEEKKDTLVKRFFSNIVIVYNSVTARIILLEDNCFVLNAINKRKNTVKIQLWHAVGAFKKFGYSVKNKKKYLQRISDQIIPIHRNYDYAIVSSKEVIPNYAEAFNMKLDRIIPLGCSRLDFFKRVNTEEIIARFYYKYPNLRNKKIILYAPTFREKEKNLNRYELSEEFTGLAKYLDKKKFCVLIKLHPYLKDKYVGSKNKLFVDCDSEFNIYELMIISDMLLTDYSSVIFEYSLLNKDIITFAEDLNEYKCERNFYYEYEKMFPSKINYSKEEVSKAIIKSTETTNNNKTLERMFVSENNNRVSHTIVKFIILKLNER